MKSDRSPQSDQLVPIDLYAARYDWTPEAIISRIQRGILDGVRLHDQWFVRMNAKAHPELQRQASAGPTILRPMLSDIMLRYEWGKGDLIIPGFTGLMWVLILLARPINWALGVFFGIVFVASVSECVAVWRRYPPKKSSGT